MSRFLVSGDVARSVDVYVVHVVNAMRSQRAEELILIIKVSAGRVDDNFISRVLIPSGRGGVDRPYHLPDGAGLAEHVRALELMVIVVVISWELVRVVLRCRQLLHRIPMRVFHVHFRVRVDESIIHVEHVKGRVGSLF